MADKHVVVDGSNIATEGRTAPSLRQLDEAVRSFVSQHPHDKVTVVVDATFGHRIAPEEQDIYEQAMLAGELISPPAGAIGRGDAFVLQIADVANATVFSNDSFQEFHGQYTWLFDEGRLIGGKPVPDVGWVFVLRSPVRGPLSRRSTRDARPRKAKQATASTVPTAKVTGATKKNAAGQAPKVGDALPVATTRAGAEGGERADAAQTPVKAARTRRRRGVTAPPEPVNERMVFIDFVTAHPVGSLVEAMVDRFSSHGAYLAAGDAQCYIPLRALADPPPRSAREVLTLGEVRPFVVASFDAARCGIDVSLPDPDLQVPAPEPVALPDPNRQEQPQEAPPMATKKTAAKKTAAKKTAAKKTAAKKTAANKTVGRTAGTAKKTAASKTPAKKATATKQTVTKSGGGTKKATPKATARKATARKTTARKTTAGKSTAGKSTAGKSTAGKSTARKTTAKRPTAQKATSTVKGAATRAQKAATTAQKAASTAKQAAKKATKSAGAAKATAAKKITAGTATTRKTAAKRSR